MGANNRPGIPGSAVNGRNAAATTRVPTRIGWRTSLLAS